jgi:hypothetical protein
MFELRDRLIGLAGSPARPPGCPFLLLPLYFGCLGRFPFRLSVASGPPGVRQRSDIVAK